MAIAPPPPTTAASSPPSAITVRRPCYNDAFDIIRDGLAGARITAIGGRTPTISGANGAGHRPRRHRQRKTPADVAPSGAKAIGAIGGRRFTTRSTPPRRGPPPAGGGRRPTVGRRTRGRPDRRRPIGHQAAADPQGAKGRSCVWGRGAHTRRRRRYNAAQGATTAPDGGTPRRQRPPAAMAAAATRQRRRRRF